MTSTRPLLNLGLVRRASAEASVSFRRIPLISVIFNIGDNKGGYRAPSVASGVSRTDLRTRFFFRVRLKLRKLP